MSVAGAQILCIDPGIINLGLCIVSVEGSKASLLEYAKIDLTEMRARQRTLSEKVKTFCDNYASKIENSLYIVIEKQPPVSAALVIQELIYTFLSKRADDIIFVNPLTVASYFGTLRLSYKERKLENIKRANKYFETLNSTNPDICDAACISIYFTEKLAESCCQNRFKKYSLKINPFERFRHDPRHDNRNVF